ATPCGASPQLSLRHLQRRARPLAPALDLSRAARPRATRPLSLHDALPIYSKEVARPSLATYACSSKHSVSSNCFSEKQFEDTLRSEEHTSELQSPDHIVCRLLLEKKQSPTLTASCISAVYRSQHRGPTL